MGAVARGARGGDEVGPPGSRSTVAYEFGDVVQLDLGGEGGALLDDHEPALCLTHAHCPSGATCMGTGGSYRLPYAISRRR